MLYLFLALNGGLFTFWSKIMVVVDKSLGGGSRSKVLRLEQRLRQDLTLNLYLLTATMSSV